jgi:hypothetical protein
MMIKNIVKRKVANWMSLNDFQNIDVEDRDEKIILLK